MTRANPFADLSDFTPKPKAEGNPVEPAQIEKLAEEAGFPSRQRRAPAAKADAPAKPALAAAAREPGKARRYLTGRNQQLNIKASAETLERFYALADELNVSLAEAFERSVEALAVASKSKS